LGEQHHWRAPDIPGQYHINAWYKMGNAAFARDWGRGLIPALMSMYNLQESISLFDMLETSRYYYKDTFELALPSDGTLQVLHFRN
jgi:hypothetical protein